RIKTNSMTPLQAFLIVLVAVAASWAFVRLRRLAAIGAAYKAKVVSSVVFGSGRTVDPSRLDEVSADSYWLMRPFRCDIDHEERAVTASLWGFSPRTALFRDHAGTPFSFSHTWPTAPARPPLDRTVAAAFLEPSRRRRRRTRSILIVQDARIVAAHYAAGCDEAPRRPVRDVCASGCCWLSRS